jgi:hypothetical protein
MQTMICNEGGLLEETLMMRDVTRKFVNEHGIPFKHQATAMYVGND